MSGIRCMKVGVGRRMLKRNIWGVRVKRRSRIRRRMIKRSQGRRSYKGRNGCSSLMMRRDKELRTGWWRRCEEPNTTSKRRRGRRRTGCPSIGVWAIDRGNRRNMS